MINDYFIKNAKFIHFIGIGGISMSGLALLALNGKIQVSGSDIKSSATIKKLKKLGAKIFLSHSEGNVKGQDLVVFSGAIKPDNVELVKAKELGVPCIERSVYLGYVSRQYKTSIAVAGTHGKTTTTAMVAKCFIDALLNPSVHLGGEVEFLDGSVRTGANYFISEACEYRKSFLKVKKDYSILLNIEADHLDYYKTIANLHNAFKKFASTSTNLITPYELAKKYHFTNSNVTTVSLTNENANYFVKNIQLLACGGHSFEVYKDGNFYYNFTLNLIGEFNVLNSLCVIALCDAIGIDKLSIYQALLTFKGVKRRFENLGCVNNAQVIHDYAHHPTEIQKVVAGFRAFYKGELIVVFEPHTYSRTKALIKEFTEVLSSDKIDKVIILPTYSARESKQDGLTGKDLANEIAKIKKTCSYMSVGTARKNLLEKSFSANTAILFVGAGSIGNFAHSFVENRK